ncbi:MAC/perforin domain-containing protein [Microcystis aeruginosa]|uniref:MAC/perforin domain-containing protein n=1 Tax=Microcystis aeruginosa TaxID=1126 RepID=UPI00287FAA31|nr:MAC/perforin domain-containing protein [Microcystis aeruginosa]WNF16375.1 MAC/perforin domain-containing protein [Microcystis aeruginosa NRERC-214]
MDILGTVKLGTTANLVLGYDPSWNLTNYDERNGLFQPQKKALTDFELDVTPENPTWSYPEISLHDSAEDLLSVLFPYTIVNPSDGIEEPTLPAGTLLISDKDRKRAIQKLSETLGINLSNQDFRYALVQLRREVGIAEHPCIEQGIRIHPNPARIPENLGVDEDFRQKLTSLRHGTDKSGRFSPDNITQANAQAYLDFFKVWGTHFVSKVTAGDVIFQVFAYPSQRFERIKKAYANGKNPLSGPEAVSFNYFTTDSNTGAFGFVKEYGKILCLSGDNKLNETLEAQDWNEPSWAGKNKNSIFAPFQKDSRISLERLNQEFTEIAPIKIELTSLALFAEHNRKKVWRRVFKAAMVQKYKGVIESKFIQYCDCDFKSQIPESEIPGFISAIATPIIDVYKPSIDLSELQLIAREEVKKFTLSANFVEQSSSKITNIPGTDVVFLAQLVNLEKCNSVPSLTLTDTAYDSATFACNRFFGALLIENQSGIKHHTIVDGLKYVLSDDESEARYSIKVEADIRKAPSPELLPRLKNSLEFSFTFAQGIINGSNVCSEQEHCCVKDGLLWLADIIPQDSSDIELLDLRVRALDLARVTTKSSLGTFVPLLPYADYKEQVTNILNYIKEINDQVYQAQEQIEQRKEKELIIDVAKTLNQNIVQSGKLLTGIVKATADQQKDLASYYDSIIDKKQEEYEGQDKKINDLERQVNEQQSEVATAVENYQQAVEDWQTRETIKFALDVATNLFSLGASILIPASSITAVKDLGLMFQRIQKVLNVLNATSKLYTSATSSLGSIQNAQQTLDGLDDFATSNLNWDEMSQNMTYILATGPSDASVTPAKAELQKAFGILVLRGKALVSAKSSAHQIARDIYLQQKQQAMSKAQAARLAQLEGYLKSGNIEDLDRSEIDLIGLTGSLVFIRSQMLGIVSKAFTLQDQSLQYQYLQPATSITSFDLLGFKGALARQSNSTIQAKTKLNQFQSSETDPIEFEVHGVDVNSLINGNTYQLSIQPDNLEFLEYFDVRVVAVVATIEDVASTDSGRYLVNLAYQGSPFYDRDTERHLLTFHTVRRERTYKYDVETNEPKFIDRGRSWSEAVNPITPFATWEIGFPKTQLNKNIRFKNSTVNLKLTFILKARIKDQPLGLRASKSKSMVLAATNAPSEQDLVSTMYNNRQGSALNGWDVVFNMSLDNINNVLASQYYELLLKGELLRDPYDKLRELKDQSEENLKTQYQTELTHQYNTLQLEKQYNILIKEPYDQLPAEIKLQTKLLSKDEYDKLLQKSYEELQSIVKSGESLLNKLDCELKKYSNSIPPHKTDPFVALEGPPKIVCSQEFNIQYGYPRLNFLVNNDQTVELEFHITGGSLTKCITIDDNPEHCDPPVSIKGETLTAIIPITKLQGLVESKGGNVYSVVLDLQKGSFKANEINMSDEERLDFNKALTAYFVEHPVRYIINSLDLSNIATLQDLTPNQFLFKVLVTPSKNKMLQLFIATANRDAKNYNQTFLNDVHEPIPQGYETSLMISSKVFFNSVLPQGLHSSMGWVLEGFKSDLKIASDDQRWISKFTAGNFSVNIDLRSLNERGHYAGGKDPVWNDGHSFWLKKNPQLWDISDMSFHSQEDGKLTLELKPQTESVEFSVETQAEYSRFTNNYSSSVTCGINALMAINITSNPQNPRDKKLSINIQTDDLQMLSVLNIEKSTACDYTKASVGKQVQQQAPSQIKSQIQAISFDAVSVFALENLLFPSGNYIDLQKVYVPGDLLILGKFKQDSNT